MPMKGLSLTIADKTNTLVLAMDIITDCAVLVVGILSYSVFTI